jgi:hypothetical protein
MFLILSFIVNFYEQYSAPTTYTDRPDNGCVLAETCKQAHNGLNC